MTDIVSPKPDIDSVSAIIREAAERCILPRFRRLAQEEVREKGPGNLVTIADEDAERFLESTLRDVVPGAVIVGEEAAARDPAVLDRLFADRATWIIDPLDGTHQFARGLDEFAIIVAYVENGDVAAGWIHDPLRHATVIAEHGGGAWLDVEDAPRRRLSVAGDRPLQALEGTLLGRLPGGARARDVAAASGRLGPLRPGGSSGRIYMRLAERRLDYAYFTRAWPWDHAAGALIHREAGGHGGFSDGSPYSPRRHIGPLLFAGDPEAWRAIRAILDDGD